MPLLTLVEKLEIIIIKLGLERNIRHLWNCKVESENSTLRELEMKSNLN